MNTNGERWAEPELQRVHGQILERMGQRREASASYQKAAELALQIGALQLARRAEAALESLRDTDISGPGRGTAGPHRA
jgi:hypothetical protein